MASQCSTIIFSVKHFSDGYAHSKIVYSKNVIHINFSILYNTLNKEYPKNFLLENLLHEIFQNKNFPIYGMSEATDSLSSLPWWLSSHSCWCGSHAYTSVKGYHCIVDLDRRHFSQNYAILLDLKARSVGSFLCRVGRCWASTLVRALAVPPSAACASAVGSSSRPRSTRRSSAGTSTAPSREPPLLRCLRRPTSSRPSRTQCCACR